MTPKFIKIMTRWNNVFYLTHSQVILRYKENGRWIEPYTIVIRYVWLHLVTTFEEA
jgi:hypothetical protein